MWAQNLNDMEKDEVDLNNEQFFTTSIHKQNLLIAIEVNAATKCTKLVPYITPKKSSTIFFPQIPSTEF